MSGEEGDVSVYPFPLPHAVGYCEALVDTQGHNRDVAVKNDAECN